MSTTTTNYGLIKPDTTDPILIGQLNDNADAVDAALKENADAIENKPDAADIPTPSTAAPAMDGTAAAGTSTNYARADHVHPSDTSKQNALTTAQFAAVNSGIDSTKVEQIETNKANISSIHKSAGTNLYFSESQPLETIPTGSYWVSTAGIKINSKTSELAPSISEWVDGYPYATTGEISPSAPHREKTSDYIEITPDIAYEFFREGGFPVGTDVAWRCFAWFDSSKTFISRIGSNGTAPLVYIAPSNAKYVRISFRTYGESIQPSLLGDIWG